MEPTVASLDARRGLRLFVSPGALATLALLLVHAWVYAFSTDDAFISFRYARNLADGHGLVFNPGFERVEGYTNFLWVLVLAGFDAIGLPPETIANVLTIALTVVLWGLVLRRAADDPVPGEPRWIAWLPCLLLAATRSVAMWSTSGLETRLFEVLIVAAAFRSIREVDAESSGVPSRPWISGALFGAAALTRPDGALIALACIGVAGLFRPAAWRRHATRVAAFALPIAAHLAFRLAYYGDYVPNTYHAKVGGRTWWEMGFVYVGGFALEYGLVLLAPIVAIGILYRVRGGWAHVPALYAAAVIPHLVYVVAIGGDHFEYRPLDLYFPFLYLAAGDGVRSWIASGRSRAAALVSTAIALLAIAWIPTQSHLQFPRDRYRPTFPGGDTDDGACERFLDPAHDPLLRWPGVRAVAAVHRDLLRRMTLQAVGARQEDHLGFYRSVEKEARRLRELIDAGRIPGTMTVALSSVGVVPYVTDLPTIDRLGLTDATVARLPILARERAMAHEKRDTWDYVARRGVIVSGIRAAHLLYAPDDTNLVTSVAGAFRSGSTPAFAVLDEDTLLAGRLPQGLEATSRLLPGLEFRSLDDPAALAELADRAVLALDARLALSPGDRDALIALGQALLIAGRSRDALAPLERAIAVSPDRISAWTALAGARSGIGDLAGAREALRRALEMARRRGAKSIVDDLAASERMLERSSL